MIEMKKTIYGKTMVVLFLVFSFTLGKAQYLPDKLGDRYLFRTIHMPDDYDGKVVCTLVKKETDLKTDKAVLYVHGYNDYFFQSQLGDSVTANGYNFYAVDLRKYGRSILEHQDPFFCKNLKEYYADVDTSLGIIRSEGNKEIYLLAHSTGGLITSLYLHDHALPLPVKGLILNSPFLDMNMSWLLEKIGIPLVSFIGIFCPRMKVQGYGEPHYSHSLLEDHNGEWNYNTDWKKLNGHPKRAGWIRAIHRGHKKAHKNLEITCPILVMSSDRSARENEGWHDKYLRSDIVLDVEDIQKYGARLGNRVTLDTIPDGMHDLILSSEPVRNITYQTIFKWLRNN